MRSAPRIMLLWIAIYGCQARAGSDLQDATLVDSDPPSLQDAKKNVKTDKTRANGVTGATGAKKGTASGKGDVEIEPATPPADYRGAGETGNL